VVFCDNGVYYLSCQLVAPNYQFVCQDYDEHNCHGHDSDIAQNDTDHDPSEYYNLAGLWS
jgi:hypothetical protein